MTRRCVYMPMRSCCDGEGERMVSVDEHGPETRVQVSMIYGCVPPSSGGGVEGKREVSVDKQGPGSERRCPYAVTHFPEKWVEGKRKESVAAWG